MAWGLPAERGAPGAWGGVAQGPIGTKARGVRERTLPPGGELLPRSQDSSDAFVSCPSPKLADGPGSRRWRAQFLLRPLALACGWLSSPCVFAWPSFCVIISSCYKGTYHTGLGPTLMTSF